ncbi:cinnamoyl-CoA reductase 1-like [Triticum dicoccoides]|uniref:cinnamoyl-CoA reductase 1-like n=1 Tax=Triticum dicoccoides TaxID=85692 RepID=UPI001890DC33|nr:cinnamoyl-CoA reductase 1-like [Triticum dicoccoides]
MPTLAEGNGGSGKTVCVTGAGGYIASWLVKLLLSRGYAVHGTVRHLGEEKTGHLRRLENASENLRLFKADLLDYDAMAAAIVGCQGVFHVATPVPSGILADPELQMLGPAVTGTTNVLTTASAASVERVVVVSSMVAVEINPKDWPQGKIRDESCWSDKEFCRSNESWYPVAKIAAEAAALEYGRETGLRVVTLNPALVFGPLLQPTINTSSQFLIYFLKGGPDETRDKLWHIVDVRDVADALLLLYEAPEASGRHICAPHFITARGLLGLLKSMYPGYPCIAEESIRDMDHPAPMTSGKLEKLGWSSRPLRETITDTVEFCREAGFLEDADGDDTPCRFPPLLNKV